MSSVSLFALKPQESAVNWRRRSQNCRDTACQFGAAGRRWEVSSGWRLQWATEDAHQSSSLYSWEPFLGLSLSLMPNSAANTAREE